MRNIQKLLLAIIAILVLTSSNTYASDFDFRKTKWGMSPQEVKSSETLTPSSEEKDVITYKSSILGKKVYIVYVFVDNQLVRSRYYLADKHTNKNDFIQDYEDFKKILTKKYGEPGSDNTFWKNNLYKDSYEDWGMAIGAGHLVFFSTWKTKQTKISNMLLGENYRIECLVEYSSNNLEELEKKAKEKEALDNF